MDGIGFVLKKIISRLCFPLGLSLLLGLAGLLVLWRLRRRRGQRLGDGGGRGIGLGWWLALAGWALLLAFSLPLTSWLPLGPLERQAGDYADVAALTVRGISTILVLGGGVHQGSRTAYDLLKSGIAQRVMEAARLWRQMPGARILLSDGSYNPSLTEAQVMAALARDLGMTASPSPRSPRLSTCVEPWARNKPRACVPFPRPPTSAPRARASPTTPCCPRPEA